MARIGLYASRDLTVRNMEHIVYQIGSILKQEHDVILVGPTKVSKRIEEKFEIIPPPVRKGLWRGPILARIHECLTFIKQYNPDIIMTVSSIGTNGMAVSITGYITKTPSIIRITSDLFNVYKTNATFKSKISLFIRNNILGPIAMLFAKKIVLMHEAQCPPLVDMGFNKEKFYVVPQPVIFPEQVDKATARKEIRKQLNFPRDCFLVGSMMRLDASKRIDLLKSVIQHAVEKAPQAYFVIIGTGGRRAELLKTFKDYKNVHFIDQMPRDELCRYYAACDCVIHLSNSEGLSNVIIEALYFKTPVIATNSSPITKAIVSNIGETTDDFIHYINSSDEVVLDVLPEKLDPKVNEKAWLDLIKSVNLSPKA